MKKFSTFNNVSRKVALLTCLVCLLTGPGSPLLAQYTYTRTFDAPQPLVNQGESNGWYQDRYAPHAFELATFNTQSVIKESISTADGAVNRPTNFKSSFRNTQGRSTILPDGTIEISIDLYIPASWATTNKRMAGLWASGAKADGGLSETYPILEFASDTLEGGTEPSPRFQGYNDQTDKWVSLGLPAAFEYDNWYTLKIELDPSTETTTYSVADKSAQVTAGDVQVLTSVMLQGYNYDPASPVDNDNPGVDYDIYWDNLSSVATGKNVYNLTAEKYYTTIQAAVTDAASMDHLLVTGPSYNEQVQINKTLTLEGNAAARPTLDFTGTVTGKPAIIDISANNVLVRNLDFHVDLSKLSSAIIASAAGMDSVSFIDNHVIPYKTGETLTPYSVRNAFSVNYAGYRAGGDYGIYFESNTVEADPANGIIFRSGLSSDVCTGQFLNNTIQSLNQDLCIRFFKNKPVTVKGNHFNGGGVEIATPESTNGLIVIEDNTFDGSMGNSFTSSLRLKDNFDFMPAVIRNNTFVNHRWAISVENFSDLTIDNNRFTPVDTATYYRHITFNTKDLSSTSGYGDATIGAVVTGNIFNGSDHTGKGIAIAFYNHDSENATIDPFVIGRRDHENSFAASIGKALYLDNHNGIPTTDLETTFPEYGELPATLTAYWSTAIDATNNKFDAGDGLTAARDMTYYEVKAVENQIFDQGSDDHLARVVLNTPVINVTKEAAATDGSQYRYTTLQEAINAASANDSIYAKAWVYNEDVNINKAGLKLNGDLHYGVDTTIIIGPNAGSVSTLSVNGMNAQITNLMVTRAGNNNAEFAANVKTGGIHIQGSTGVVLRHLLVTGNRNGIYINNTNGTTIDSCDIVFNRTGIQLVNTCDNTVITHNNITDNWTVGVLAYSQSAGQTSNITANYNKIAGNWYSEVENRSDGTILNFNGNNWNRLTMAPVDNTAGEPGYADLIPVEYGGTATYGSGNHYQITGGLDRVDYSAWLPDTMSNAIDNNQFPGYAPSDTSLVYIDEASPTAGGMTKIARAQSIVAVGGKVVSTSAVLHTTLTPGKPFELTSTTGELTIDGIDFGTEENPAPIEINQNITITGPVNLGNGAIKMGEGKTLTIDAHSSTIDLSGGTGYISGTLVVENVPSGASYTFPVGDSLSGPKYLEFAPTGGTSGSFTVTYSNEGFSSHELAKDDADNLTSVDQTRFWNFERTAGDLKGKVTIKDYSNSLPLDAVIAHFGADNKWHNLGGTFLQASDPQILQATLETDEFSPFTIGSTTAALPVHIAGFEGKLTGNTVQFTWETLTESNNKGFGLERSKDGQTWQQIAFIATKASNGTSSQPLHYSALDYQPVTGLNYYRLRQDTRGQSAASYSKVKTIQVGPGSNISIYPNPATDIIYINGLSGTIGIYNANGKLLHTQRSTSATIQISVSGFAAGVYYIKDSEGHQTKFIKK